MKRIPGGLSIMNSVEHTPAGFSREEKEQELQRSLALNPGSLPDLYSLGLLYETEFLDYHKAIRIYRRIVELYEKECRAWYSLGLIYYLLCNDKKAIDAFQKVAELDGLTYPACYTYLGRLIKNPLEAESWVKKGLEVHEDLPEAREILGDLQTERGEHKEALQSYEEDLQRNPGDLELRLKKIYSLIQLNELDRAEAELEECSAREDCESLPEYWNARGDLARKKGDPVAAAQYYAKALQQKKDDAGALRNLSELDRESGELQQALDKIEQLLLKDPTDIKALDLKASLFIQMGRFRQAIEIFDQILVIAPKRYQALALKAEMHMRLSEFTDALIAMERLIALRPNDAIVHFQMGLVFDRMNRYSSSLASYERAIELNGKFGSAWNNKGYALYRLNRYQDAIESYTKTIEMKPNFAAAFYNRGCARCLLSETEGALEDLSSSFSMEERFRTMAAEDTDLSSLRELEKFQSLLQAG